MMILIRACDRKGGQTWKGKSNRLNIKPVLNVLRMSARENEVKLWGLMIAIIGLVLLAIALLTFQSPAVAHDGMMGLGQSTGASGYALSNMVMAIIGALMLAGGAVYAFFLGNRRYAAYHPAPFIPIRADPAGAAGGTAVPDPSTPVEGMADSGLVLRLLSGDEQAMFRAIVEAGGEPLQKNLVTTTKMSEAKVSRVIDRLVEKGLVAKERNGMGNRVRIQIDN